MQIKEQHAFLKRLETFMKKFYKDDPQALDDVCFRTGKEAKDYSDFASNHFPWMSFEARVCSDLYYGYDNGEFNKALTKWCDNEKVYFEFEYCWCCSFIPDDE